MESSEDAIREEIIEKIKKNRISTTEIADCLGKTGDIPGLVPINRQHFCVGKVFLAYGFNESNWGIHEQLQDVNEGDVVIVETHNCNKRAAFGEIVAKFLLLYKGASAAVINGYMRDAHRLIKENFPIWCKGVTPIGCYNKKNEEELDAKILDDWKNKYEGAIAVCDDGGVVIISRKNINKEFLEKLDFIEIQEDIWHYCVDTKKWTTYDTVCLKKYIKTELLPKELRERFETFLEKLNKK
jgi:regulator of RNase E activity RraA